MKRIHRACAVLLFMLLLHLCVLSRPPEEMQETTRPDETEYCPEAGVTNLSAVYEAVRIVMESGTKSFFAGYPVDEAFLCWVAERYGSRTLEHIAYELIMEAAGDELWYELTGRTMHVLWLDYCREYSYATYLCEPVIWKEADDPECITIDFIGDINFDERWYTMQSAEALGGVDACIGERVQSELQSADLTVVNNEFTYTRTDEALEGKEYTFRTEPSNVKLLELFGTDFVSLANNHTYDYGEQGLLDTLDTLQEAGIPYGGAGRNLAEASAVRYFVVGGRKLAIVCATEIERYSHYTKAATETSPGVFRTRQENEVLEAIREAREYSDYVLAYIHWGGEGNLIRDDGQAGLAQTYKDAGVDAVIGGHPHRLQGVAFMDRVPVAFSLGNFWFSNGTLYTTIAQLQIDYRGKMSLRMLPCIQREGRTEMLDGEEAREFYRYLADISTDVAIDDAGCVYPCQNGESVYAYTSGQRYGARRGAEDLDGRGIDIVGNLQ